MQARSKQWPVATLQAGLMAWAGASVAADKVYVANEDADTISVLDAASFQVLATVPVGKAPHNVQVSPDGKTAWVTNNGEPGPAGDAAAHAGMAQAAHEAMGVGAVWVIDTGSDTLAA
jgi:YVTN family beta-propeller protein